MAKYDKFSPQSRMPKRPYTIHPIWQGIGCLLLVIIPIISYAAAILIVEENIKAQWLPMTGELLRTVEIQGIGGVEHLYGNLLVGAILAIFIFTLIFAFYALVYKAVGPSPYGPMDAPPDEFRNVKKKPRL